MGLGSNLVKHPKKDEEEVEEIEEEVEVEEEDHKSKLRNLQDYAKDDDSSSSPAKSRMIKFMGLIVIGTIVILVILFVISSLKPKVYTYTEIESILQEAAESYFADHSEALPQNEGSVIEIDSSNLSAEGYMKDLSEYTEEGVVCAGTVQVEHAGGSYLYTPYLNCGDSYATTELYKKITDNNNIVTSGYGLYASNGSYIFRGEDVNNYVKLDKILWRIVKVTANNNVVLISDEGVGFGQLWDDRYNEGKSYEAGINQYSVSRIKEYLTKVYKNPSKKKEEGELIFSKRDKTRLVNYDLCVGKREQGREGKDNSAECSQKLPNQTLGLLTVSEYMAASLDPDCKSTVSKSCKNYNYLAKTKDWWLVTADKDDNSQVYQVNQSGKVVSELAGSFSGVRPVIYLNSKVLYKSGNGTLERPYRVK